MVNIGGVMVKRRDPRRDPIPGDVLRDRNGQEHVVMPLATAHCRDLKYFRRHFRGAVVLKRATAGVSK